MVSHSKRHITIFPTGKSKKEDAFSTSEVRQFGRSAWRFHLVFP